ncbi:sirohydrochlorin chelatase [Oceanobacillus salinisoli]|uniref:sirohydrochlorin chelatase n=1 Tax=Oceanobacillus salinisoli TaxID=2678611 RepID=UPI0012E29331|nr:sirohydrochlorin chelatase [Oceanobacillus salinisoli]
MKAVLYVSHGSRLSEARAEALSFIEAVKSKVDISLQQICFLELAEPDVEQGIENLILQGATQISIIPVLLLSAGHYFHDIPEEIRHLKETYPQVEFIYGKPLGVQDRLTAILKERIEEQLIPVNKDATILVVGRGSTNPQTKVDMESIRQRLENITGFSDVDVCYLAVCKPSFETALQKALEEETSQVFVVPYLWFTGVLMNFINQKANDVKTKKQIVVCRHLGDHPMMKQALLERVYESFNSDYRF